MEPEWIVMRVAYSVLFITLALMAWAYTIQAQQASPLISDPARGHDGNLLDSYPPCSFNPLCTCSKPGPTEFGVVACHDIPFGNVPLTLNSSRVFLLSMVGNNMQVLEDKRLVGSGLWRLEIKRNNLNLIADEAFFGLSKFLSELDFEGNQLTSVPTGALRRLARSGKLRALNLAYNKITDILPNDLEGLPSSITALSLAGNRITYIQEDVFLSLPRLEQLSLNDNSIQLIHSQAFASTKLQGLHLSNNLFQKIPFEAVAHLDLKTLDMSKNLITSTFDIYFDRKLSISELNLEYNRITHFPSFALQNFRKVKIFRASYNPIEGIADDAFKDGKVEELDLSSCFIYDIQEKAFRGLENSLETLDLSFNNISFINPDIFANLDKLTYLNLDENKLQVNHGMDSFAPFTLHKFSLIGDKMGPFPMEGILPMRNLRSLNISNLGGMTSLTPQTFDGFGLAVENIKISQAGITSIKSGAFSSLTGLKSLDLSENRIGLIENDAFDGIGHSLVKLVMHESLRMSSVPAAPFQKLVALQYLDLTSNGIASIPENTFHENKRLIYLNLRFNKLSAIPINLLDSTRKLQRIFLSFNQIKEIEEETFSRLKHLEIIELNENLVEAIHPKAFEDLTNLKILNLAGNKLSILEDNSFQNLPHLQTLDLSYNQLVSFNLDAFDQLGTLSSLRINLCHNSIQRLVSKEASQVQETTHHESEEESEEDKDHEDVLHVSSISSSSIEAIDLSFNNLTFISPYFFDPISGTLIELDLSHNRLQNLTLEHLSGMNFLQNLKLSDNNIDSLEYNTFRESRNIQLLNLNNNLLRDFPPDLFEGCTQLRYLTASGNKFRALTDTIFKDAKLEILKIAGNQLVRFPENALAKVASTLVELDLSGNEISSLAPTQIECLQKLRWLSLQGNRIVVIAEMTFDNLHLQHLDLSGNPMGRLSSRLFDKLRDNLLQLHLANMSLEILPEFDTFSKLLTFNSSYNRLTYLPTNFGVNVSTLRSLDISGNEIPSPPNTIWHTIPRLERILMRANPIKSLTNESFLQLERLHELDISELPLDSVQAGIFSPLGCLQTISLGPLSPDINAGLLIQNVEALQNIHLKMNSPTMTSGLSSFPIPPKVSGITLSGKELMDISATAFNGVKGRQLKLGFANTGIVKLSDVFENIGDATQLSLSIIGGNSSIKTISNPNTEFRREAFSTYLEDLQLPEGMALSCTCEMGWLEFWLREWLEDNCPVDSHSKDDSIRCNGMLQTLREVKCEGKETNLMQAFVTTLECGWKSSANQLLMGYFKFIMFLSLILTFLF